MDRMRIGIFYYKNADWAAGAMYIENLLKSLNFLDESQKPFVYVFNKKETFRELLQLTKYSYLKYSFFYRLLKKLKLYKFKFIFPTEQSVAWIPDFQDKYYPEFFEEEELQKRDNRHKNYVLAKTPIVFSSEDAKNDFDKFYPQNENVKFVLNFAVSHPDFSQLNIDKVKKKFDINGNYYFCANQFWQHKNHRYLFNEIKTLKDKGKNIQLVCSGSVKDRRNQNYFPELQKFISENKLESNIKILGFIDRAEQLLLMKNSIAVIQPSLFEGWSTTVEDCKALNKFIFLSNLNVHLEQMKENAQFFNPKKEGDLSDKIQNTEIVEKEIDYKKNVKKFAEDFYGIVKKLA